MAQPTTVDVEDFPEPARRALADAIGQRFFAMARPASSSGSNLLLIAGLCVLGYALFAGYGRLYTARQSPESIALYLGGFGGVAFGVLLMRKRKQLARLLGFAPGVYVLGTRLLDARQRTLKAYALTDARPQVTDHYHNRVYQQTTITWHGVIFAFRNKPSAGEALGRIDATFAALSQAAQANDFQRLLVLDPVTIGFSMMNSGAPRARPPQRKPWVLPVAVTAGVAVLSPLTWYVRNRLSLEAAFDDIYDPYQVDTWVAMGGDAARGYKKKMELEMTRALRAPLANELRRVLAAYPDAPEDLAGPVKAALKARYQEARKQALALSQAPQVTWFINQVYDRLEAGNAVAAMQIKIARTDNSGLKQLDEFVETRPKLRGTIVPVAKYFDTADDKDRTQRLKTTIEQGLEKFFPHDVMVFDAEAKDAPTIEIFYVIGPKIRPDGTPSLYVEMDDAGRPTPGAMSYPGIQFELGATLKVPGGPKPQAVTFTATPAPTITVRDTTDQAAVYRAMAESVFSDLRNKLVVALGGKAEQPFRDKSSLDKSSLDKPLD